MDRNRTIESELIGMVQRHAEESTRLDKECARLTAVNISLLKTCIALRDYLISKGEDPEEIALLDAALRTAKGE